MLLSLLPVSALAAAPVFDAPAQTTGPKKGLHPLCTREARRLPGSTRRRKAATRSSRDLDAENNTAESITIDLDAKGNPTSQGDVAHWYYNATALFLNSGTFTLQPSSEPGAASALQPGLFIKRSAEFKGGTAGNWTTNRGTISGGTFQGEASNRGTISGGTFEKKVLLMNGDASITISDGLFDGVVVNKDVTARFPSPAACLPKMWMYTPSARAIFLSPAVILWQSLSCRKAATPALPLCAIRMAEPSKCL